MSETESTRPPKQFKSFFWQPPRAHGDIIEDRSVSFLELFYDLVYVVVISQAAHHLAAHVSWRGAAEFAVVFGLVWIAWMNGSVYHDLHGRGDGRTRTFVFVQMALLSLLAVYTAGATDTDGTAFAIVYCAFLIVLTWLWYSVSLQDDPSYRSTTTPYLIGMLASVAVVAGSAFLSDDIRLILWGTLVIGWVGGIAALDRLVGAVRDSGLSATDSLVERFGLFTIIVLGEVIVGVVTGIAESDRSTSAIVTGMIGLMIGFAYWWTYFDFVGGRRVRSTGGAASLWALGHLPATMTITASGAAMVSLIEHSSDERAPAGTAWLLSGSVAIGLIALVVIMAALQDAPRLHDVYRPLSTALGGAALLAIVIGWLRPAPWALASLLVAELAIIWLFAIFRWLASPNPGDFIPALGEP